MINRILYTLLFAFIGFIIYISMSLYIIIETIDDLHRVVRPQTHYRSIE